MVDVHDSTGVPGGTTVTLALDGRQTAHLERLSAQIRSATGTVLSAATVIKALIEALSEAAAVNPSAIRSDDDLKDLFYRRFTRQEDPRHDRDRMRV